MPWRHDYEDVLDEKLQHLVYAERSTPTLSERRLVQRLYQPRQGGLKLLDQRRRGCGFGKCVRGRKG